MRYNKFLLCTIALSCLAFQACAQMTSSGDWNRPDRSMMDPGIAGMLQWLDTSVPNYPWYSSTSGPFYTQAVPDTTFLPYREYYTTTVTPVEGGIISAPAKFNITQATPSSVYYGAGQGLPYSQYISLVPSKTNDLWVRGATNWTQYVVSPAGAWLQLVANAPIGGSAGFYETVQTDTTTQQYTTYQFYQGYNTMNFYADRIGRHMLYFVVNNQPSNVVIVDVFAQAPTTPVSFNKPYIGPTSTYAGIGQGAKPS